MTTTAEAAGTVAAAPSPPASEPLARAGDAAVTTLLNCFLRETGADVGGDGRLRLRRLGLELLAPLAHRSATGHHTWRLPVRLVAAAEPVALDHVVLAALLAKELASGSSGDHGPRLGELLTEIVASAANVATFLAEARPPAPAPAAPVAGLEAAGAPGPEAAGPPAPNTPFIVAEQSLAFGHPLHPTAKSRVGMDPGELRAWSPELGAAFPLHWFRADRSIVAEDSALEGATATGLLARLLGEPDDHGTALLPTHPGQARRLLERPRVRALLEAGLLDDLGPIGAPWQPTSSVRTVYRAGAPFMLKLSLGVRITNSVRANLAKELARGVEVKRLLDAGLAAELAARFPRFAIVPDPAWATLRDGGGRESGFEVVLRANPYPASAPPDATVVAALCATPAGGGPSRLARIVHSLASGTGQPVDATARRWFRRHLELAADPLLWLDGARGIALEAHQQNVVVELEGGWPAGCRYRDNQGYYFKASRAERLRALLPDLNRSSDTICDDAVANERFGYYLGINHLLGMVGALGAAGLADERDLLADLAEHLRSSTSGSPLARTLADASTLRCKANLRTRLAGLDELAGPLETQSVYVDLPNPVAAAAGRHR